MVNVVKRNGRKQRFSRAKLAKSIEKAARESGMNAARAGDVCDSMSADIAKRIKDRDQIKSTDLRRRVLGRLDRKAKRVAACWRRHERKVKKRK